MWSEIIEKNLGKWHAKAPEFENFRGSNGQEPRIWRGGIFQGSRVRLFIFIFISISLHLILQCTEVQFNICTTSALSLAVDTSRGAP